MKNSLTDAAVQVMDYNRSLCIILWQDSSFRSAVLVTSRLLWTSFLKECTSSSRSGTCAFITLLHGKTSGTLSAVSAWKRFQY